MVLSALEEEWPRERGFIEKPAGARRFPIWRIRVFISFDPACLALVPEGRPFDFAKDLFPEMMRRGMPLYGYRAEGYWCDIGDLRAYLQCQRDLLAGKGEGTALHLEICAGYFLGRERA